MVTILRAFAVSRFEVTFAEWDACVKDGGCDGYRPDAPWGRGRMPVVNINFKNAEAYAAWLSRKTGHRYRLLSEAEWEYAARAGSTAPFAYGPALSAAQANFDASSKTELNPKGAARGKAVAVGAFKPNAFGLYDMHGNVWEWVEDCWNDEYGPFLAPVTASPPSPATATAGSCAAAPGKTAPPTSAPRRGVASAMGGPVVVGRDQGGAGALASYVRTKQPTP